MRVARIGAIALALVLAAFAFAAAPHGPSPEPAGSGSERLPMPAASPEAPAAHTGVQAATGTIPPSMYPRYTGDGRLYQPEGFETWVFVGASIGLSYADTPEGSDPGTFHHTYMQPWAYEHYRETGEFAEKTILVLELYESAQKVSPAKEGYFEGRRLGLDVALKDHEAFEEGWAYFNFENGRLEAAAAFPKSRCYDCHLEHGADDNVFTQFYPVLRRLKEARETGG